MNEKIAKRNIKFTGCGGDFTKGREAVFLTPLDEIEPVDPVGNASPPGRIRGKRHVQAVLGRLVAAAPPHRSQPHVEAIWRAISRIWPHPPLADAVRMGKTIEADLLSELVNTSRPWRYPEASTSTYSWIY